MPVEPDPIYRLEGLPDSATSYVDTQGDLVIPSMVAFNQRFFNTTQFLGGVIFDSVSVIGHIDVGDSVTVGNNLNVTNDLKVEGAFELSSGTRVNSIQTTVRTSGATDDILVTEQAVQEVIANLQSQINSLEYRISVLENS